MGFQLLRNPTGQGVHFDVALTPKDRVYVRQRARFLYRIEPGFRCPSKQPISYLGEH
jgi:hypothetical protein